MSAAADALVQFKHKYLKYIFDFLFLILIFNELLNNKKQQQ